jgi:hypothetical protein
MSPADRDPTKPIKDDVGSITPTTPLRLETAARIAFPDGSMKLAGLRREIARGRLAYEVIAGKHYVTLADIEDMRRLCRVQARAPGAKSSQRALAFWLSADAASSSTGEERSPPQQLLAARLSRRLQKRQKKDSGDT